MSDNFIPRQDHLALAWMQNLAARFTANPGLYFVTPADALTVTNAVQLFATALTIATEPGTRTRPTINAKDTARNAAEQVCRQFAILCKYNAGITDEDKIDAGIRPVNPDRDPIDCPQTSPIVNVQAATPGSHTLRVTDSLEPEKRGKPFGASDCLLFCTIGEEPATNPDDAKFIGKFTKNPISVEFSAGDNTKIATYFAKWSSRKGEVGPWSLPISMAIAA